MGLYAYLIFENNGKLVSPQGGGEKDMANLLYDYGDKVSKNFANFLSGEGDDKIAWVTVRKLNNFLAKIKNKMEEEGEEDYLLEIVEEYMEELQEHSPQDKVIIDIG